KRKVWLAATVLSTFAWVGQVAALALAPVALVVPLLATGSAVLVVLGVRFLHERFRTSELVGVALVAAGAAAAGAAEAGSTASHEALRFSVQFMIVIVAAVCAALTLRWRTGVAYGAASGFGFAGVAIFSKEIGDGFANRGIRAVPHLLASPAPYLLLGVSIGALSLLQAGFQRGNAASVMAALSVPESIGPLIAGFWLYHEKYPHGVAAGVLPAGLLCPGRAAPTKMFRTTRKIQLCNCPRIPGARRFHNTSASHAPMIPKIAPDAPALRSLCENARDVAEPRTPASMYRRKKRSLRYRSS